MINDIPSLTSYATKRDVVTTLASYATLANPALTGTATVNRSSLLTLSINNVMVKKQCGTGRYIKIGSDTGNTASINFHANDNNTTGVNYDARI